MYAFFQNAISFVLVYSSFVWTNIQALYIQKLSGISFQLKGYIFLQDTGIQKPDY